MGITSIQRAAIPNTGIVGIITTDTLATAAGANYITAQQANIIAANSGEFSWNANDTILVAASDGNDFFTINSTFTTLSAFPAGNGAVTLPVVSGDFTVFNGTLGGLKDAGYSASDATKTKVVMATGAVIANHIATYTDTAGTIGENAATAINGGNIQAGLSGTAGTLASFPTTAAKGSLVVAGVANTGNTNTTISNAAMGQASVISIPDPAGATAQFVVAPAALVSGNIVEASGTAGLVADGLLAANKLLTSGITTPDVSIDLVAFDVTVGQAALAAGGSVTLQASSGSKQYKIRNLWINSGGTAFSGGGGDRLGQVTDGTTVFSVVPAANLQTLTNNAWGSTPLPFPAAAAIDTSTAAGTALTFKYSGGTTDYTAGSIVVSGVLQRVA